ncbi:MAG: cell division protein FtsZ [Bacteroidetes bacterium]|nr:cell division protein FtsZ [Bacteroidota bacterium]MCL1968280.1 cell division protein FtsZ [Bacteroidota bacterium]
MRERIDFTPDYGSKTTQSIIKVIGVGGGGGNAVKHMYKEGIIGVDFLICNTDRNALEASPIPSKLVLGESGLGAGANPEVARQLALESKEQIIDFIGTETKMLFITAGLGKGTGTGAAPVVAEIARELGILTIAVVTLPFRFEGTTSAQFAEAGVTELKKHVDSLIIIKNQNIIKYYNDEELDKAFGYADDVLKNAVKCIAELITVNLEQNIDFNDISSIMRNSGAAMLGIAEASGENRINEVLEDVLKCPLLTEEHISNARNFLFSISYGSEQKLRIWELEKLTDKFEELKSKNSHVIWGRSEDPTLGNKIKLSVIISKYDTADIKVFGSVGTAEGLYDGDRQPDARSVDIGTTVTSSSSPINMEPIIKDEPVKSIKEEDDFDFLNKRETPEIRREMVTEPVAGFVAGPQRIRSTYEPKYEDDDQFSFLVDTPAIQRLRQENKEDFQDKALQDNHSSSFILEDDIHEFFKNLPD